MIFEAKIVSEAVWEPKLAPRVAQIGFRGGWGARKSPQGGEEERQEGAKMAQDGPQEAQLEALGADFGRKLEENWVKTGNKIRKCKKRRI